MKKVNILETTLRDGSYAIDFSFTTADTRRICKELESAGFEYIEIGHGIGLNASKSGYGKAIQTDTEYLEAASNVLEKAKFGMFCIPGIARLEDIDLAAKFNMKFIRIGTNANEVEKSQRFIERAKKHGMFVAANYMKSYTISPKEFAKQVKFSQEYGADMVYVVDSAGGMFEKDIEKYYYAIREISNISLGYHGHNNLSMGVANSLKAVELGFDFVDSSLQGLGRSSGNAPTECLVAALIKLGYDLDLNLFKVLEIGQNLIKPMLNSKGLHPLDIVAGFADFHSSFMKLIHKYAAKYSVNPAVLIIEISKVNKTNVEETELDRIASQIKKEEDLFLANYNFSRYIGSEQQKLNKNS